MGLAMAAGLSIGCYAAGRSSEAVSHIAVGAERIGIYAEAAVIAGGDHGLIRRFHERTAFDKLVTPGV
jgi:hypothetical protein